VDNGRAYSHILRLLVLLNPPNRWVLGSKVELISRMSAVPQGRDRVTKSERENVGRQVPSRPSPGICSAVTL